MPRSYFVEMLSAQVGKDHVAAHVRRRYGVWPAVPVVTASATATGSCDVRAKALPHSDIQDDSQDTLNKDVAGTWAVLRTCKPVWNLSVQADSAVAASGAL